MQQNLKRLKVLLVDDNPEFLKTAAAFLSAYAMLEVVGLAQSGQEAVEIARKLNPELVIMDLAMPEMNGLDTTRRIKALPAPPQVVIVTLYDGPEFSSLAHAAGADDFITKSEFGELLLPAVLKLFPHLQAEPAHECA
ncbi:MAG: chemotaxis protein CheY [Pedosphaera sp.]|nr:chemotaxis protein CheY [Pedosphaera sp.]